MQRRTFLAASAAAALARPALAQVGRARNPACCASCPRATCSNPDPIWTTRHGRPQPRIHDLGHAVRPGSRRPPQPADGRRARGLRRRLTWRFTLREDLVFHDNKPVRAHDCVPSILRWAKRRGLGQAMLARLDEIRALDDRRFEIRLNQPFRSMLEALGTDTCFIMPERISPDRPVQPITASMSAAGRSGSCRDEWVSGRAGGLCALGQIRADRGRAGLHQRRQGGAFRPRRVDRHARPRHRRGGACSRARWTGCSCR